MLLINEDNTNTNRTANPLGAWLNAQERSKAAEEAHADVFDTDEHVDRVAQVGEIVKAFFGQYPNYHTKRANRGKPFESVKVSDCGYTLRKASTEDKNTRLYKPLMDMGNVDVKSTNGHLLIRVFPTK
jgi:hypothetical protein